MAVQIMPIVSKEEGDLVSIFRLSMANRKQEIISHSKRNTQLPMMLRHDDEMTRRSSSRHDAYETYDLSQVVHVLVRLL